jgi:hypothetical protein
VAAFVALWALGRLGQARPITTTTSATARPST